MINEKISQLKKESYTQDAQRLGEEEAPELYKEKIYEFLTYLNAENIHDIPIRMLKKEGAHCYPRYAALTTTSGIWLNKKLLFSGNLGSYHQFVLAHEAVHWTHMHTEKGNFSLNLGHSTFTNFFEILGIFLCYRAIKNNQNNSKLLLMSIITRSCSMVYSKVVKKVVGKKIMPFFWCRYRKTQEKQADLKAAEILCKHGYEHVVKDTIKTTKNIIKRSTGAASTDNEHPSFEEQLAYLQKFWDKWQQKNENATRG